MEGIFQLYAPAALSPVTAPLNHRVGVSVDRRAGQDENNL